LWRRTSRELHSLVMSNHPSSAAPYGSVTFTLLAARRRSPTCLDSG
jgi:hypothetical protein